ASVSLAFSVMAVRPSHFVSTYNAESRCQSPHELCGIFEMGSVGGVRFALLQLGVQPGPGVRPPALGRVRRDAGRLRGVGDRQAGEVAQFDQTGLAFIELLEPLQGLVEGQDVEGRLRSGELDVGDVLALAVATVALTLFAASLVDEDAAHG